MEERYIRNLGALSEAECALLREKTVLVAGRELEAGKLYVADLLDMELQSLF